MAQEYNIEMKRYNGTDYDTLYPKTHIDNVDGITGAVSNVMQTNLDSGYALMSDGDGKIIASTVTAVALDYISGVTSDVQYQLDSKANITSVESATIFANGWILDATTNLYWYRMNFTGVTIRSNQEVIPGLNITADQLAALQAANLQDGGQGDGYFNIIAYGDKPTIDLPIRVILRSDDIGNIV